MLKPFSMIFFIAVMVWIGGIFITSNPQTRIDRACLPATFADRVLVAVVQVIHEPYAMGAHEMMLAVEYGCKFTVWKTFYEDRESYDARQMRQASQHASEQKKGDGRLDVRNANEKSELTEVRMPGAPLPNYLNNK